MEVQDINSVCRLCLSETVFLSVLDENYASLPQKILSFVNVEVIIGFMWFFEGFLSGLICFVWLVGKLGYLTYLLG